MVPMHAIVLSYGPAALTRGATRRLRQAGATTQVIRASKAAPRLPDGDANMIVGTRAIEAALSDLDPGEPSLLVHDDIILPPRAIRAMLRTFEESDARYVVPYTNDEHMDHGIGTVPEDFDRLSRFRAPAETRTVRRIRPAAVLGRVADLKLLLGHHPADPRTRFDDVTLGFVAAGGAVAFHEGTCANRLVRPGSETLLVAALIVKDEEAMLPGCLASLEGLVDRIEICDTGSTDRTIEIANRYGAHVIHRPWRNDFAWARNQVLEQCEDAVWALVIDADERIDAADVEAIRRFLATYEEEYESLRIPVVSVEGSRSSRFFSTRLIHPRSTRYVGAVHEMPRTIGREHEPTPFGSLELLRLVHHGYEAQVIAERDKAHRNLSIAKDAYERDPNPKAALEYARSQMLAGSLTEETVELFDQALASVDGQHASIVANVLTLRARVLSALNRLEEAQSSLEEALYQVPGDLNAAALLGELAKHLDTPERYATTLETARSRASVRPLHVVEAEVARVSSRLSWAYCRLGRVDDALREAARALTAGGFDEWSSLFELLRITGRAADALPLVVNAKDISYAEAAARILGVGTAAELALQQLASGVEIPEAVEFGLVAAMVSGRTDLMERLGKWLPLLDEATRARLQLRAKARGDAEALGVLMAAATSAAS